jgi:hypothetical protein
LRNGAAIPITASFTAHHCARQSIGNQQLAIGNSHGRAAADVNESEPLEEMTIVERLRRAVLGINSHESFQAADMPQVEIG